MHHPSSRVTEHAKLFTVKGRQVLAYLYRDDEDALVVALQLWCAASDEQIRAAVRTESDEDALLYFASLDADTIAQSLTAIGLTEQLERIESALA